MYLPDGLAACSTFEQGHRLCKNCLRNIGFYHAKQKIWKTYKIVDDECPSFLKRDNKLNERLNKKNTDS